MENLKNILIHKPHNNYFHFHVTINYISAYNPQQRQLSSEIREYKFQKSSG